MIKIKDGYAKLIGTTYSGSVSRVLLSNGGDHILGNSNSNIPLNNGTVNANLNADMLDGLHIHAGRNNEVNKIVRTDAGGHILAGWINTTSSDIGTGTINKIYCSNDNYIRYKTPANFFETLANDNNQISITVGSQNRKVTVAYAKTATSLGSGALMHMCSLYAANTYNAYKIVTNWHKSLNIMPTINIRGYAYGSIRTIDCDIVMYHYNDDSCNYSLTNKGSYPIRVWQTIENDILVFYINPGEYYGMFNVFVYGGMNSSTFTNWSMITVDEVSGTEISSKPIATNITGNSSTATKLQTVRTLTIGNTGKSFDGSSNVSWSLSEIGAASSEHTHTTSIAISTDTNQITLVYGGKYKLTAGGTSYVFTMPTSDNTWRPIGTGATDAAAGNHIHKNLIIKWGAGNTEGTNLFTYNGGTAKTINLSTPFSLLFTNFSNAGSLTTSISIGGTTKTLKIDADTVDGFHATSGNNKPWGTIPAITTNGFMDIGKLLEFHFDNTTGSDYSTILRCTGNYSNIVNLPSAAGTLALTSDIPTTLPANGGNADTTDGVHITWAGKLTSTSHLVAWEANGSALRDINPANVTVGNSDKLDGYHANGLLTALSNSNNGISITVGGTTKSVSNISVNYASSAGNADTVDGYHASNLVKFYLSPMASGAPADSAKSWFIDMMPSASGAIVYNVPGSEKTIIAGKSSGAHGHMLQLNYDDTYLRILRYYKSSWKSTDWEKISAGYADSAGSVAWSNITDRPSSLKNPYSLNIFGVTYDGSAAKTVTTSTFVSLLSEDTSTVTDGTMFITSVVSNSGFADTNAVNVPYKRKASCLWSYIDSKVSSKYLPLAGGTMNGNARISHDNGNLYIGSADNNGWVMTQDIASQSGTDKWYIKTSGASCFGTIHIASKTDGSFNSNVIECNSTINLNYFSSLNVSLCNGGGTVQIGPYTTGDTGNNKLYVNGSEFINGASNVKDHVFADGFRHRSHNSNDSVLLAGGGYSQGVPVRYWAIYYMYIGNSSTDVTYTKRSGNYDFITSEAWESEGSARFDISFPSGYNKNNTLIFGSGDHRTSSSWKTPVYVTITTSPQFGSESQIRVMISDDASLNTGFANIYFMCMG